MALEILTFIKEFFRLRIIAASDASFSIAWPPHLALSISFRVGGGFLIAIWGKSVNHVRKHGLFPSQAVYVHTSMVF